MSTPYRSALRPRRHRAGRLALVMAMAGGLIAPLAAQDTPTARAAGPTTEARPPYLDPKLPVPQRVSDLLGRMTMQEKIGQMTQAERAAIDAEPAKIAGARLGSVLSGGGSVPTPNTPKAWADMVDRYQRAALTTRLRIPLLYGVDSVHGHGNLIGATVFPHNIGLGATRDPALVRRAAHVTAAETRATGPNWAFAACVCVARDDRWGRTYESFGETPQLVTQMETAFDGLQGAPGELKNADRVLASAKHFAGDGLTTYGTGSNDHTDGDYPIDQGVAQVNRSTFDRLALSPYGPAIGKHRAGSVMPSYSDVDWTEDGLGNRINLHAYRQLITGWLKQKMRYDGLVISDYEGIHHIKPESYTYDQQVVAGVNAGIDLFMEPYDYASFEHSLSKAVQAGQVSTARIDDAVRRILTAKFELGLFEHPFTDRTHLAQVGSAAHRAVARTAVAKSQVLLKNSRNLLPLRPGTKVYVAGSNADNIGNQAGGWTVTWQGGSKNVIPGTTILQGIRKHIPNATFSADASAGVPRNAIGVVVVGETPYAEGFGDVGGPRWSGDPADQGQPRPPQTMRLNAADSKAVDKVCSAARACVVVTVSGRPVVLPQRQLNTIDAFVAAWLPGSEGDGVADPMFGTTPYSGKLPVSWPRSVGQEPINVGDRRYDPQFAFGAGLTTRAH